MLPNYFSCTYKPQQYFINLKIDIKCKNVFNDLL